MGKYDEQKFIPCLQRVYAKFSDGEMYPILCWAITDISGPDDDDSCLVPVGMIAEDGSPYLVEVTNYGSDFVGYVYVS